MTVGYQLWLGEKDWDTINWDVVGKAFIANTVASFTSNFINERFHLSGSGALITNVAAGAGVGLFQSWLTTPQQEFSPLDFNFAESGFFGGISGAIPSKYGLIILSAAISQFPGQEKSIEWWRGEKNYNPYYALNNLFNESLSVFENIDDEGNTTTYSFDKDSQTGNKTITDQEGHVVELTILEQDPEQDNTWSPSFHFDYQTGIGLMLMKDEDQASLVSLIYDPERQVWTTDAEYPILLKEE